MIRRLGQLCVLTSGAVLSAVALSAVMLASGAGAQLLPSDTESDCTGRTPIVVASDEAAQSDMYSAETLAGVLGHSCVVLAGPRDAPMDVTQRARLDATYWDWGGWIVGGTAAVPEAKVAGYDLTRLDGVDRWHTARLVGVFGAISAADLDLLRVDLGERAAAIVWLTDATAPVIETSAEPDDTYVDDPLDPIRQFKVVAAGWSHSCVIRADATLVCWGKNDHGQTNAPDGTFTHVAGGSSSSCAIRTDSRVVCWGAGYYEMGIDLWWTVNALEGTFGRVVGSDDHQCRISTTNTITCWNENARE